MVLASIPKPSPRPHAKKRHGQHHKASKHYVKTYWPYLPMAVIIGLGVWVNVAWSNGGNVLGVTTPISTVSLLQQTNIERGEQNSAALSLNNTLSVAAQQKADDMAARDYWSHTTPDGKQPWQFMTDNNYSYALAGENLAYGFRDNSAVIASWMNSQAHRDNILKKDYKEVGFGIATAPRYQGKTDQTIIVAMYAAPSSSLAQNQVTKDESETGLVAKPVSRFEVMTTDMGSRAFVAAIIFAATLAIIFVYRHGRMWRKYLVKGERYLMKHPLYDIGLLAAIVVSIVLSKTSGFIH